jgi:hypothetical protein
MRIVNQPPRRRLRALIGTNCDEPWTFWVPPPRHLLLPLDRYALRSDRDVDALRVACNVGAK